MNREVLSVIKRQIPFLIGGTVTGIIMTYYLGFLVTIIVNSAIWYLVSQVTYKHIWNKSASTDQRILLGYFLTRIKSKHPDTRITKPWTHVRPHKIRVSTPHIRLYSLGSRVKSHLLSFDFFFPLPKQATQLL